MVKRNSLGVLILTLYMSLHMIIRDSEDGKPASGITIQSENPMPSEQAYRPQPLGEDGTEQEDMLYFTVHYAGDVLSARAESEYTAAHYINDRLTEEEEIDYYLTAHATNAVPAEADGRVSAPR